ncbi:MAG: hydrogenase maturation protease, partial [Planctomycetota bacterium]
STGWETLNAIKNEGLLILIDAAEENELFPAGQWCRLDYPHTNEVIINYKLRDTHSMSIDSMLRMGHALGWLPPEVWIYVIAGKCFQPEAGISPSVAKAINQIAGQIESDIRIWSQKNNPAPDSICI